MITAANGNRALETLVGMGQIAAGAAPTQFRAIVGSCIALALYHPGQKFGVMSHIVLPESAQRSGTPGKFADTAIPRMLDMLREAGVSVRDLTVKFAGGANMFGRPGPLQIGEANVAAVAAALQKLPDRAGRNSRVVFDCAKGTMTVECAGQRGKTI